jgi:hypothetical protein
MAIIHLQPANCTHQRPTQDFQLLSMFICHWLLLASTDFWLMIECRLASCPCHVTSIWISWKTSLPSISLLLYVYYLMQKCIPCHCLAVAASHCLTLPAFSSHVNINNLLFPGCIPCTSSTWKGYNWSSGTVHQKCALRGLFHIRVWCDKCYIMDYHAKHLILPSHSVHTVSAASNVCRWHECICFTHIAVYLCRCIFWVVSHQVTNTGVSSVKL